MRFGGLVICLKSGTRSPKPHVGSLVSELQTSFIHVRGKRRYFCHSQNVVQLFLPNNSGCVAACIAEGVGSTSITSSSARTVYVLMHHMCHAYQFPNLCISYLAFVFHSTSSVASANEKSNAKYTTTSTARIEFCLHSSDNV